MRHSHRQFVLENLEDPLDSLRSVRAQAPSRNPAEAHCFSAERQRLEDVAAAPKSAIDHNRDPAGDSIHDLRQNFKSCRPVVKRAPAVVRYDNSIQAVLDAKDGGSRTA